MRSTNKKKLLNLGIDFIIASSIIGLGYITYLFSIINYFGLFRCGESLLNEWYKCRNFFIISLLTQILISLLIIKAIKKKEKKNKYIYKFVILIGFYFPILFGRNTFNIAAYYADFNKEIWIDKTYKPINMVRSMIENKKFIGESKNSILKTIGIERINNNEEIEFETDKSGTAVKLIFKNDTLHSYKLVCSGKPTGETRE